LRLYSAGHFSAPKILSSTFRCAHGVSEIRFSSIQISSKGFATASRHFGRFLQIHFSHEVGDLVFPEMAVDEIEGLFGDAKVLRVGPGQTQPRGGRLQKTLQHVVSKKNQESR